MTYEVVWDEAAKDDPDGLRQLMDSIDLLAAQPRPEGSAEYGSADVRRMHMGRYRVLYEITEATITVVVIHIGRVGLHTCEGVLSCSPHPAGMTPAGACGRDDHCLLPACVGMVRSCTPTSDAITGPVLRCGLWKARTA